MTPDKNDEITKPYNCPQLFIDEALPTERDLEKPTEPPPPPAATIPAPAPDFFDRELDEEPLSSMF